MDGSALETTVTPLFGDIHVLLPAARHSHTVVLLHGRGCTGEEFADELFESNLANGLSLREALPGCKWVFPSSRELWSATFEEHIPTWFEAHSLTDITARQYLQVGGIEDSVSHVCKIIEEEVQLLGGKTEKLVLGGISQGGAIAIWTLLYMRKRGIQGLGAFIGASTWLPFADNVRSVLLAGSEPHSAPSSFDSFIKDMMIPLPEQTEKECFEAILSTPVFLGHGTDDAYVDVNLGKEAMEILSGVGFKVQWREYTGAEQEGHWLKVPQEVDDIRIFLAAQGIGGPGVEHPSSDGQRRGFSGLV